MFQQGEFDKLRRTKSTIKSFNSSAVFDEENIADKNNSDKNKTEKPTEIFQYRKQKSERI